METKICSKCKKKLPADNKYFNKGNGTSALFPSCKDCISLKNKEYRKNNIEKCIENDIIRTLTNFGYEITPEIIEIKKLQYRIRKNSFFEFKGIKFKSIQEFGKWGEKYTNGKLLACTIIKRISSYGYSLEDSLLIGRKTLYFKNKKAILQITNLNTNEVKSFTTLKEAALWTKKSPSYLRDCIKNNVTITSNYKNSRTSSTYKIEKL